MKKMTWSQVPRLAAFGLMASAFLLSGYGQAAEFTSVELPQSRFTIRDDGSSDHDNWFQYRATASACKCWALVLVLSGPPVWFVGSYLLPKHARRSEKSSTAVE